MMDNVHKDNIHLIKMLIWQEYLQAEVMHDLPLCYVITALISTVSIW
jgi:hypothetical protein